MFVILCLIYICITLELYYQRIKKCTDVNDDDECIVKIEYINSQYCNKNLEEIPANYS